MRRIREQPIERSFINRFCAEALCAHRVRSRNHHFSEMVEAKRFSCESDRNLAATAFDMAMAIHGSPSRDWARAKKPLTPRMIFPLVSGGAKNIDPCAENETLPHIAADKKNKSAGRRPPADSRSISGVVQRDSIWIVPELVRNSTTGPPEPTFPCSSRGLMVPCTVIGKLELMLPELVCA